jgi:ribonuclease HI
VNIQRRQSARNEKSRLTSSPRSTSPIRARPRAASSKPAPRLNANVDKANNFLVKRFYNIDHNAYLEGPLPAKTKELMGLVASACLRCDDCIFYHAIQAYRLGVTRAEQEESLNVALVIGGSIVIPHLRRAYELLEEMYG